MTIMSRRGGAAFAAAATLLATSIAMPASAQEAEEAPSEETIWTQPVLLDGPDSFRYDLRANGINLDLWLTQFGQSAVGGDGDSALQYGGKIDARVTLIGDQLDIWPGLVISVHQEFIYGDDANNQGDGTYLPVNTALALPRLGDGDAETSIVVSQRFSEQFTVSAGKFNMLDAASRAPLIGGGGLDTFQNMALAAPISGVTPPYIIGISLSLDTDPVNFGLLIYDPRNAQDDSVINSLFGEGVTFSLSATIPLTIGGLPGFHSFRGVYSTQSGIDLRDIPQIVLPPEFGGIVREQSSYAYGSYTFQQYLARNPGNPRKGWGLFGEIGVSDGNPNPFSFHYYLGIGGDSPIGGRSNDRWGIAYFHYELSDDIRESVEQLGLDLGNESGVEAFYNLAATQWLRISANMQIIDPFPSASDTAIFLGMRTQLRF
ncbi:carbohydrate porin [Parasphingopyxis sp.]|uniref:carbohydrate porin n=1 Tax=Parasphingopyxis sp. TaxID=1920299 RepID=UPI002612D5C7|nr:carbohydrate porin [Parasphingopyxis sp.]